jgi:superfamily I DNA and RNA helicase
MVKKKKGTFLSKLKENIGIILLTLALIGGIFAFDSRYEKSLQAQQQKEEVLKSFEQLNKNLTQQKQQNDTLFQQQKQQADQNFLQQDEKRLYDREKSLKREIQRYPKDQSLKDELSDVQKQRNDLTNQINIMRAK